MDAENGFTIDGRIYPVVSFDMFDLDEGEIFYTHTGLLMEDFVREEKETDEEYERRMRVTRTPKFWRTMMFIAYRRKHRDEDPGKAWALMGRQNQITAVRTIAGDDEIPPELTTLPDASLSSETDSSLPTTGSVSSGSSTEQDDPQSSISTIASGTSSESIHARSVA